MYQQYGLTSDDILRTIFDILLDFGLEFGRAESFESKQALFALTLLGEPSCCCQIIHPPGHTSIPLLGVSSTCTLSDQAAQN
jgi:hypothetical protein